MRQFFAQYFSQASELVVMLLVQLYQVTGDLGAAIIVFTLLLRALLLPLTLPSLKAQKQLRALQPELNKLKKKHQGDRQKLQMATMEMYQKYNVNPLAGCLPQLAQIAILIFLYRALTQFLGQSEVQGVVINSHFLWMNLATPDTSFVLPVIAGVTQLVLSLMIAPGAEIPDIQPNQATSKKQQKANEKEEDMADMAASMQQQMLFLMPVMTVIIATRFPAGIALYWIVTTIFSIGQQYVITGWGGLFTYSQRAYVVVTQFAKSKLT